MPTTPRYKGPSVPLPRRTGKVAELAAPYGLTAAPLRSTEADEVFDTLLAGQSIAALQATGHLPPKLNRYTVDLSSRVADYDVSISGIPATSAAEAEKIALSFMASGTVWLCTGTDLSR